MSDFETRDYAAGFRDGKLDAEATIARLTAEVERLKRENDNQANGALAVINQSVTEEHRLTARVAELEAMRRWNIEQDGDDLLVCFNDHEKGEKCEYVRYVRAALTARVAHLEALLRKARTAVSALREMEKASKAHGEALKMDCDLAEIDAALSQPAPNRETDWGPDVGNEILPPPPEKESDDEFGKLWS
jgi:hypothetical protein